jgi:hypothetical protein
MKLGRLVSTATLCFFLGASALTYAQEQREEPKAAPEEARPEPAKPAPDEMKPRQEEPKNQKPDQAQDKDKQAPRNDKPVKQDDAKPAERAQQSNEHAEHAADQHASRIPDDKFRANFGRQHTFKINRPTVVEGRPRFQYGGYWFNISDAWPADWAYTDDCYVDFIDGEYYLIDLSHPGVRLALVVVM